jgi:hypothetical protein
MFPTTATLEQRNGRTATAPYRQGAAGLLQVLLPVNVFVGMHSDSASNDGELYGIIKLQNSN